MSDSAAKWHAKAAIRAAMRRDMCMNKARESKTVSGEDRTLVSLWVNSARGWNQSLLWNMRALGRLS